MKKSFFLSLLILLNVGVYAQYKEYARRIIDSLCSERYHGRGYVFNGDLLAATFIENGFKSLELTPVNGTYKQKFQFVINTFPGAMEVKIGNRVLVPAKDFLISAFSHGCKGNYSLLPLKKREVISDAHMKRLAKKNLSEYFLVIDLSELNEKEKHKVQEEIYFYNQIASGIILLTNEKLTWGQKNYFTTIPVLEIKKESFPLNEKNIYINIENRLIDDYASYNVMAMAPALQKTDSFIVFTAHYDHLGRMGKDTYFPGANDNASGTAMLLTLAQYFKKNPIRYNVVFIAFAAEEIGLLGSKYFVENPLIDLKKIKLLINLDLVGTGDEGITVVNSASNVNAFDKLIKLNEESKSLPAIKPRKNAPNSDHYPFTQKNVPAVFIYTLGGPQAYHDLDDRPETLPLTRFDELVSLLIRWVKVL